MFYFFVCLKFLRMTGAIEANHVLSQKPALQIHILHPSSLCCTCRISWCLILLKQQKTPLYYSAYVSQLFAFLPHRQTIVWSLQTALCSTSYGYCSNWVRRSSWKRLIPCTYFIPGVVLTSQQMRQEWKQQWRMLQPGLLSFVSTPLEMLGRCCAIWFLYWRYMEVLDASKSLPCSLNAFPRCCLLSLLL